VLLRKHSKIHRYSAREKTISFFFIFRFENNMLTAGGSGPASQFTSPSRNEGDVLRGEDTHGEAGENASQLASRVLDYADDDKPWEKEDGR
jgi:hypothetical protein